MGANLALADAEALGECLAAVVTGGQAVPAALGRFEEAPAAGRRRLPAEPPDRQRAAGMPRADSFGRGADGDERRREHGAPEPYMS